MFNNIYLFGSLLSFMLALVQIMKGFSIRNWILFGIFSSMGIFQIKGFFILCGLWMEYSHFYAVEIFFILLIGPSLFIYFNMMIGVMQFSDRKIFAHLLPSLLFLIYYFCDTALIFFYNPSFRDLSADFKSRYNVLYYLVSFVPCGYLVVLARSFFLIFKGNFLRIGWPFHIFVIFVLSLFSTSVSIFIGTRFLLHFQDHFLELYRLLLFLFFCIIVYTFFVSQIYPITFNLLSETMSRLQYEKSTLNRLNPEEMKKKVICLMVTKKAHLDPGLSLKSMSERLEISPHQLSELLNQYLNTNFNSFVNFYRIQEAKDSLLNEGEKTILTIAYESGFNSLSVFNATFKKEVGVTPRFFRKQKGEI
ncbi:helix-turn-helix transcriptional regulator [Leptospira sp. 201903070]|uniref:Helix-turn-helix transcriptional regulator n=1 Tax=Leptospira ainlahdjerensis TaxID=2810033 RepID=A0ABS2UEF2_9LEPT|nr:AraC family transcriptional regulator [Leptospira ainlahdjerensis]MBM9578745.1 helix-turn-helix transcriptional regulator [Leptospira ainlahdjerensis]